MRLYPLSSDSDYTRVTLPSLPDVPTLTTENERAYLYWLVKEYYEGLGVVVEVGTWFGASAYYLAAGLRDLESGAGRGSHPQTKATASLYCFDRFRVTPGDVAHAAEQGYELGSLDTDAQPFLQQDLDAIYPHTQLIETDIN